MFQYNSVNASATGGGGSAETYTESFNATGDWGAASGGFYTITVPRSTHGKSVQPLVQVYELVSGDFEQVIIETEINTLGDVSIRVTETLDTRFEGKVIIL